MSPHRELMAQLLRASSDILRIVASVGFDGEENGNLRTTMLRQAGLEEAGDSYGWRITPLGVRLKDWEGAARQLAWDAGQLAEEVALARAAKQAADKLEGK
jgi:hypothetical protein